MWHTLTHNQPLISSKGHYFNLLIRDFLSKKDFAEKKVNNLHDSSFCLPLKNDQTIRKECANFIKCRGLF